MNILIFLGSTRRSTPPSPARLGERVALYLKSLIEIQGYSVEVIDPLQIDFPEVFKPHFSYTKNHIPEDLETLSKKIKNADAYVMLSPEYNHSMSPALSHMLNHFGSSSYSYKPSLITTYSQGQWGGARAAVNMRTFLGELGCIAVSAMIHVPRAHLVFTEKGEIVETESRSDWDSYLNHGLAQLYWWAEACRDKIKAKNPHTYIESFKKNPQERDTPV
jgi:chromate reductase